MVGLKIELWWLIETNAALGKRQPEFESGIFSIVTINR
jgi:hypothetical protein